MAPHKRKSKTVTVCAASKLKKSKVKKKAASKKKTKKKSEKNSNSNCDTRASKKVNNDQNPNKNNPIHSAITVQKTKIPCRRYEPFHDHFLTYDQIVAFLQKTQKTNPDSVDIVTIGFSGQRKPIFMVLITTDPSSPLPKHATFITAGLNGEEPIAVSNALYIIDYLSKHPNYVKIMDYYVVPCVNPDAYDSFIKSRGNEEKNNSRVKRSNSNHCNLVTKKPKLENGKAVSQVPKNNCDCIFLGLDWEVVASSSSKSKKNVSPANKKDSKRQNGLCKTNPKKGDKANKKQNEGQSNTNNNGSNGEKEMNKSELFRMDLSLNFPVVLGLNDMRRIPTPSFLDKMKSWKEGYLNNSPETCALVRAINTYQFAIKLLICLQEGGEAICYPYGFCSTANEETEDLKQIAKKGKSAITGRNFQFGATYDIHGLTYGNLIDFLKVDKSSIKYTYTIHVHKKSAKYNEKHELKNLMYYGCEVMECVKRMSTAVYKSYTNMTGNKEVETEGTKLGLDKRSPF